MKFILHLQEHILRAEDPSVSTFWDLGCETVPFDYIVGKEYVEVIHPIDWFIELETVADVVDFTKKYGKISIKDEHLTILNGDWD